MNAGPVPVGEDEPFLHVGPAGLPALVWTFDPPRRAIASTPLGGGIGVSRFVVNAQVPLDYARCDLETHLRAVAADAGCTGDGIGFLTAASVADWTVARSGAVTAVATIGLRDPEWAAAPDTGAKPASIGTINVIAFAPVCFTDAALVNTVITLTEAKTQALVEAGVPGTGTASDAACIVAPTGGDAEPFGGPRSRVGAHLARAVRDAVKAGATRPGSSST